MFWWSEKAFSVLTPVFTRMSIVDGLDFSYSSHVSEEDVEAARERKAEHVYESFVYPVLEDSSGRKVFQVNEVKDEIRPPYSYREVKDALEYASSETGEVDLLEEDMDLFLYSE